MWKWLIPLGGVALLVAFILWHRDSEKTSYVNGLAEYIKLPDREFLFERDCYIFKLKARNTAWPLVGMKAAVPGLPVEVDSKNIGAEFPDVRIIDVVRAGARFKIFSVRRDESRRS